MLIRFINFLRGYLIIEVQGFFIERFINLAIKSKIYLWGIKRTKKNTAIMKISVAGFRRLRSAARKTKTKVKILKKKGLPLFLYRHRKRKAFYIGIAVFAVILVFLTSFIWSVEINGTEKIEKNTIRDALKSCGIDVGVIKYNHSSHKIQDEMMLQVPDLAWIWVEIRGTRAIVTVKERTEKPEITQSDKPCNIVATRDGVVLRTVVRSGKRVVSEGDIVKRGDLLVSGVEDSNYAGILKMHSDGEIYAATWHEKNGVFPLSKEIVQKSGNAYRKYSFAGIKVFPLFEKPYASFETQKNEFSLRLWGDLYLPFTWKSELLEETNTIYEPLSQEDALQYYSQQLFEQLEQEAGDGVQVTKRECTHELTEGGISIKCTLQCEEQIGEKRELEINDFGG